MSERIEGRKLEAAWSQDVFERDEEIVPPERRRAEADWYVERTEVGPIRNPQYILSVRHRRNRTAGRVLTATGDFERVARMEREANSALARLSSADFAALLQLSLPEEGSEGTSRPH